MHIRILNTVSRIRKERLYINEEVSLNDFLILKSLTELLKECRYQKLICASFQNGLIK